MGILDQALSQFGGNGLAEIASRVGISEAQVQSVIGALGSNAPEPGSAVDAAATQTGLSVEKVQQVLEAIGGRDGLARLTGALSHGGGMEAITSGLFGKN